MKLVRYVIAMTFLFAMLDWQVIHYTRIMNRRWLVAMHEHEQQYAAITNTIEIILCTPCMVLKPAMFHAILNASASEEEKQAILHAPQPDLRGFWHLPKRGESWTFVRWIDWVLLWLGPSILWLWLKERLASRGK